MPSSNQQIDFTGTVRSVRSMRRGSSGAWQTHRDPRFEVTINVASVVGASELLRTGEDRTFAIHSPVKLFGASDPTGQSYKLRLIGRDVDGATSWRLELVRN